MNHLDFDEIVEYVSLNTLDEHALRLASKVDTHVRTCDECLELVNAVMTIHEEFVRLKNSKELEGSRKEALVVDEELKNMIEDVRALKKEKSLKKEEFLFNYDE